MGDFATATTVEGSDGRYRARLDADWFAWGPFGGYLAALAVRAVGAEARLPWPATFSGLFLNAGEAGDVEIEVRVLKCGKRAEALRATIVQGDRPLFDASIWLVDAGLKGLTHNHARMPAVQPAERLRSYRELVADYDQWFPFWRHIEGRPMQWHDPDSRPPPDPAWQCWLRLNQSPLPDAPVMRAAVAAMWLDFPGWNAAAQAHPWPLTHIAPTLDLTLQFQAALYEGAASSAWVLAEGVCPTAAGGLVGATGNLWSHDGTLLAACTTQMFCRPNPSYEQELARMAAARADKQKTGV